MRRTKLCYARLQIPAVARKISLYLAPTSHRRAFFVSMNQVLSFRLTLLYILNGKAAAEEISSSALTGDQQQVVDESVNVTNEESSSEALSSEEQKTESEEITGSDSEVQTAEEEAVKTLQMKIADTVVEVAWEDNESVEALRKLCEEEQLTIEMSMYGGFEQVGSIGSNLPRNDVETTTSAGDIVLYSGNKMVVFYGSNSWAYTRLGHITDQDEAGMTQLLSNGDVTITVSLEDAK